MSEAAVPDPDHEDVAAMNPPMPPVPALQVVPGDVPATGEACRLANAILTAELSVDRAVEAMAHHFTSQERTVTVVTALTTLAPTDTTGWVHLGQRAWLREWHSPGSPCRLVPDPDSGPEAALSMPWVSQRARDELVVFPDATLLPAEAEQDRRELELCNVAASMTSSQIQGNVMYGSFTVVSSVPGVWDDAYVADMRLLTAALTSRMSAEHAQRSLADAIAVGDQARASQQQFFATIGHELRTPIAAILGFAEVLGDEAREQGPDAGRFVKAVEHDSGVILRAAEQLLAIIEDLLSTGRTLGHEEARDDHDVAAAVADVIHWHRTPALAARVSVTSVIEPGVTVHARTSGLRQVLTNLIGNAIIHNRPGGSVEISTQRSYGESREPRVRIVVRDTGRGLAPAELARVFEPFVRFAAAEVKGTGLGLSLARAVAERDGGVVGAESTPGEGSVFWVDLPASSA